MKDKRKCKNPIICKISKTILKTIHSLSNIRTMYHLKHNEYKQYSENQTAFSLTSQMALKYPTKNDKRFIPSKHNKIYTINLTIQRNIFFLLQKSNGIHHITLTHQKTLQYRRKLFDPHVEFGIIRNLRNFNLPHHLDI